MTSTGDLDNLDFKIIKEVWNEYDLKGGAKFRARLVLTRLAENKNAPPPPNLPPGQSSMALSMSVQTIVSIFAPETSKGQPTALIPAPNQIKDDKKQEVEILTFQEPWNVYEVIKNGTIIRAKLIVNKVYRVIDVYDQFGEPYHLVESGPVFNVEPPKSKNKFA